MSKPFSPRKLLLPLVPAYRLALALRELGLGTRLEPVRRLRWPVAAGLPAPPASSPPAANPPAAGPAQPARGPRQSGGYG